MLCLWSISPQCKLTPQIAVSADFKSLHIKEIVETQGLPQAKTTLEKWFHEPKKKTLKMFIEHPFIKEAFDLISNNPEKHPKLQKLVTILKERITLNTLFLSDGLFPRLSSIS